MIGVARKFRKSHTLRPLSVTHVLWDNHLFFQRITPVVLGKRGCQRQFLSDLLAILYFIQQLSYFDKTSFWIG
ncbi:MAG: hypothetical protein ACRC10_05465 [Thermoguttaceae bacterium]